jgi:uncharacterized protein YhbP (UPF0306 family)
MNPEEVAKKYIDQGKTMQLGTFREDWPVSVVSLYYIPSDDYSSLYWMSEPRRRHSHDIKREPRVGGAITIREDWPTLGLQFKGTANVVDDIDEIQKATDKYTEKYGSAAEGFTERYKAGKNKHLFYKLTMTSLELIDNENFPGDQIEIPLG